MKAGVTLETRRLLLRHWRADDLDIFHRINSDKMMMRYFPFRRDILQAADLLRRLEEIIAETGFGWCAAVDKQSDEVIGFTGLARVRFEASFTPAVEIGWRLVPEHWGKGYATEAANSLLHHGFTCLGLTEIVAFAVPANAASTAVMRRIGMRARPDLDFDMPGIADEYAHLRRHVLFSLSQREWLAQNNANK